MKFEVTRLALFILCKENGLSCQHQTWYTCTMMYSIWQWLRINWPGGQKVKDQGHSVTKTVTVTWLLVKCAAAAAAGVGCARRTTASVSSFHCSACKLLARRGLHRWMCGRSTGTRERPPPWLRPTNWSRSAVSLAFIAPSTVITSRQPPPHTITARAGWLFRAHTSLSTCLI